VWRTLFAGLTWQEFMAQPASAVSKALTYEAVKAEVQEAKRKLKESPGG